MRFRCYSSLCGKAPKYFEFEADCPLCPKCGAASAPTVHELTDVHFLVMGSGPLQGVHGPFHVACEPDRSYLAQHPHDQYAASDMPHAVTCPRCRGTKAFQEFVRALFPAMWAEMQGQKTTKAIVDLGNCGCPK